MKAELSKEDIATLKAGIDDINAEKTVLNKTDQLFRNLKKGEDRRAGLATLDLPTGASAITPLIDKALAGGKLTDVQIRTLKETVDALNKYNKLLPEDIPADELNPGDSFMSKGEKHTVKEITEDGQVKIQNGKVEYLWPGETIEIDRGTLEKKPDNTPTYKRETVGASATSPAPAFYSKLRKVIDQKMPNRADVKTISGIIGGSGVKNDELTWSGIKDFLDGKEKVDKNELLDYLDKNQVEVKEVTLGGGAVPLSEQDMVRLKELEKMNAKNPLGAIEDIESGSWDELLTLQNRRDGLTIEQLYAKQKEIEKKAQQAQARGDKKLADKLWGESNHYNARAENIGINPDESLGIQPKFSQYTLPGGEGYTEIVFVNEQLVNDGYRSPHFPEIAGYNGHIRFTIRRMPDGKKMLLLEEVQNDRHQKGREEGYATAGQTRKTTAEIERGDKVAGLGTVDAIERNITLPAGAKTVKTKYGYKVLGPDGKDAVGKLYMQKQSAELAYYDVTGQGEQYRQFRINDKWYHEKLIKPENVTTPAKGVPPAPFSKTWHEQAIKRALRYAAENGYDGIGWTTGEQQAERYDLSKQVDAVSTFSVPIGKVSIEA